MIYLCFALCLCNTAALLLLLRRKQEPLSEEEQQTEAQRKCREEKINALAEYNPFGI